MQREQVQEGIVDVPVEEEIENNECAN